MDGEGNVYAVAEHYERGRDVKYHCERIREISDSLGWKRTRTGAVYALIDSAANQRTLACEKSVTELFCENGIAVNPKVEKNLFAGINRVRSYLAGENGKPKIYIFDVCRNLIRELKAYRYGSDDSPVKRDDHALDELRYYLMTKPRAVRAPETKGELGQFKERLIKHVGRR